VKVTTLSAPESPKSGALRPEDLGISAMMGGGSNLSLRSEAQISIGKMQLANCHSAKRKSRVHCPALLFIGQCLRIGIELLSFGNWHKSPTL
jgi:hypothetical protein